MAMMVTGRSALQSFNTEARARFLAFATASSAPWSANFRDLGAAVTRMATLAEGGRIGEDLVREETGRLHQQWHAPSAVGDGGDGGDDPLSEVLGTAVARIDLFDRVQLTEVIRVCRAARSLSEAGRILFAVTRLERKTANDADRLQKYLARFGTDWAACRATAR